MKSIVYTLLSVLTPGKKENVSHKCELIGHSSTGEGRGPLRGDQRQSDEVSKQTNPTPDSTDPSPSVHQWFAP